MGEVPVQGVLELGEPREVTDRQVELVWGMGERLENEFPDSIVVLDRALEDLESCAGPNTLAPVSEDVLLSEPDADDDLLPVTSEGPGMMKSLLLKPPLSDEERELARAGKLSRKAAVEADGTMVWSDELPKETTFILDGLYDLTEASVAAYTIDDESFGQIVYKGRHYDSDVYFVELYRPIWINKKPEMTFSVMLVGAAHAEAAMSGNIWL